MPNRARSFRLPLATECWAPAPVTSRSPRAHLLEQPIHRLAALGQHDPEMGCAGPVGGSNRGLGEVEDDPASLLRPAPGGVPRR